MIESCPLKEIKVDKKTILILSANPKVTDRLRLDEEVREIEEGLNRSNRRDDFKIIPRWAINIRNLRRAILDNKPDIIHFCGHGQKDGIILEDELGFPIVVNQEALTDLFRLVKDTVKCVLLIACLSESQAKAISKHIKTVIGMKKEIKDKAAIEFSVGFYDALGAGRPVEKAFEFGLNALKHMDNGEHEIPICFNNEKAGINEPSTGTSDAPLELAIRSLRGYDEDIGDMGIEMLCLFDYFKGRYLCKGTWDDIKQEIKLFLEQNISAGKRYNFYLPLHASLAFLVGRALPVIRYTGIDVYQSSSPRQLWQRSKNTDKRKTFDPWLLDEEKMNVNGDEMAVAISVTHETLNDARAYIHNELPGVSHLVHLHLPNISQISITNADHSFVLANKAITFMKEKRRSQNVSRIHLFIAAPNVFNVHLGQHSRLQKHITLYEFDNDAGKFGENFPSVEV
ncbi:MAG: SAVED domain-containing protein [bacterium]|nr:SAVED domain-containing protein [bacterium]